MQVLFLKTNTHHQSNQSDKQRPGASFQARPAKRPTWSPQASGLTRDETRELVLEMIG